MANEGDDATAAAVTLTVRRWCRVVTQSGSVYHVVESTRGEFFARVDNVPNAFSVSISPDRWWRIEPAVPWPPQIGQSLALVALAELPLAHTERMPGGGKITSLVRAIDEATWMSGEIRCRATSRRRDDR